MMDRRQKKQLYRWTGWFFLMTSIILFFIQLSFLKYLPNLNEIYAVTTGKLIFTAIYLLTSYIAQAALLAFAAALITLLLTALFNRRWLTFGAGIIFGSALVVAQSVDVITYSLYHAHEILTGWEVFKTGAFGQVLPMSLAELGFLLLIIVVVLALLSGIAKLTWRRIQKNNQGQKATVISVMVIVCLFFSYGMTASVLSVPIRYQLNNTMGLLILKSQLFVPYYTQIYDLIMPINNPYKRTIDTRQGWLSYQTEAPTLPMRYPINPLHYATQTPLPNILFIVIDTWRYDAMNKIVSPHIYHFSKKTLQFKDHWSGGNCTQTGIFSLFYGLPGNYWHSTIADHQGPILINALQKNYYQMGIFASATLKFPAFNKNVFVDVKNLKTETEGKTTAARDIKITQEFKQFLKTRDQHRPFFGFVFYDAAHNYCGGGANGHQQPFKPAVKECARFSLTKDSDPLPYKNRYLNAVYFIDQEVEQVLEALKQHGLYDNTIVIITADHGEQLNDEKLGYWSHNSAYSPYQLHVPMLIYWPGIPPRVIHYFSTHYDVVPTLMKEIFDLRNSATDYSIGQSMFIPDRSIYTITGNYTNYAVLTHKRHTTFYPNGAYTIKTPLSQQLPQAQIDVPLIKKANKDLVRYYNR